MLRFPHKIPLSSRECAGNVPLVYPNPLDRRRRVVDAVGMKTLEAPATSQANVKPPKPVKPTADFPLSARWTGKEWRWAKKYAAQGNRPVYFGTDARAAYKLFCIEDEDWKAGRNPRSKAKLIVAENVEYATGFAQVTDLWIEHRKRERQVRIDDGKGGISRSSYNGSVAAIDAFEKAVKAQAAKVGKKAPMETTPSWWKPVKTALGKGVKTSTWAQRVIHVRACMNWAAKRGSNGERGALLPALPEWGDEFKCITKEELDLSKYETQIERGERVFTIEQARALLRAVNNAVDSINNRIGEMSVGGGAKVERAMVISAYLMRACYWISANSGAYQAMIAELEFKHVKLEDGMIRAVRWKKKTAWQASLWPETIQAIRDYLEHRPEPAREEYASYIFLTSDGYPVKHETDAKALGGYCTDVLANHCKKLTDDLGFSADYLTYGAWRHTFTSLAVSAGKDGITRRITGHKIQGSMDNYVFIRKAQAEEVTDVVRGQLLPVG
jgi:integrase